VILIVFSSALALAVASAVAAGFSLVTAGVLVWASVFFVSLLLQALNKLKVNTLAKVIERPFFTKDIE
jgi:hypothetical protein